MKTLAIFGVIINCLAVVIQAINHNWIWVLLNGACAIYLAHFLIQRRYE